MENKIENENERERFFKIEIKYHGEVVLVAQDCELTVKPLLSYSLGCNGSTGWCWRWLYSSGFKDSYMVPQSTGNHYFVEKFVH